MSKQWNPRKPTVELRPSRIRRDPRLIQREEKKVAPMSAEQEIWLGVTGVVLFAMAIAVVTAGFSVITGRGDAGAQAVNPERFGDCEGSADCVIDGNTIRIAGKTVKVAGMEAPQIYSARCDEEEARGAKALGRLTDLLNSGKVTTAGEEREPDGELRTRVLVDGRDVGATMVAAHLARVPESEAPSWCSE